MIGCMQGLRILYEHTGRGAEWARLVDELVPGPRRPGHRRPPTRPRRAVERCSPTTGSGSPTTAGTGPRAERLQHAARRPRDRDRAADALATAPDRRTDAAPPPHPQPRRRRASSRAHPARAGATRLPDPLPARPPTSYRRIGDRRARSHRRVQPRPRLPGRPALRDLDQAEHWHRRASTSLDEHDRLGRARTTATRHGRLSSGSSTPAPPAQPDAGAARATSTPPPAATRGPRPAARRRTETAPPSTTSSASSTPTPASTTPRWPLPAGHPLPRGRRRQLRRRPDPLQRRAPARRRRAAPATPCTTPAPPCRDYEPYGATPPPTSTTSSNSSPCWNASADPQAT